MRIRSLLLAAFGLFSFLSLPSFGSVVTTVTCTATASAGTFSQTDPTSCSASAGPIQAPASTSAFASASIANTASLGDGYTSSFDYHIQTDVPVFGVASASLNGSNTVNLTSGGPMRSGYLSITQDYSISGLAIDANYTLNVGSFSQTCTQSTFSFFPVCNAGPERTQPATFIVPFTLGQAFTFSQTVATDASVNGSIRHYADGRATVRIALLEGDLANPQSVPLALSDVPEPGSFALLSSGLLGLTILARRANRSKS